MDGNCVDLLGCGSSCQHRLVTVHGQLVCVCVYVRLKLVHHQLNVYMYTCTCTLYIQLSVWFT